ncbi:hypothetical protein ACFQ3P_41175 [Paraburkholderia sabiae]|uniref:Uncharacterized protein n=1 Tax=Paraburkholderia sabiae TaxID=273251 RepID=A0ABU9QRL3_9BURK|nr:hypothetical protein [Paraburkholderia sabiae]WJZ79367.1 hypothetical protein QEN71_41805 [Paraburkholderia sabiae]CAD6563039.1 hypothetical protein LMG24235_08281 [Paraburkholderia sabiae]
MTGPLRARYGATDNKHTLCDFDGDGEPPRALLGLTDKPPGSYRPGDVWWPSIGFGPVGGWWTLWCTRPDKEATRAGMVTSQALLWPIGEISGVEDLTPFICEVTGEALTLPAMSITEAAAQAILAGRDRAPVLVGLQHWSGLIAVLWRRLPGADRSAFSGRVMLNPPQHKGDDKCTILCTPDDRAAQWPSVRRVHDLQPEETSRAAKWMAGGDDSGLEQITRALSSTLTLGRLGTIARAAARLDSLRDKASPGDAILLIRSLILVAPDREILVGLKTEALAVIAAGIEGVDANVLRSMANIDDGALPDLSAVKAGISRWIERNAPETEPADFASIIQALAPSRSRDWWRLAVESTLAEHLYSVRWSSALFRWLSCSRCRSVLKSIWRFDQLEMSMIAAAESYGAAGAQEASGILEACAEFGWSTLHAQMCKRTMSTHDALERQLAFPGSTLPGIEWLVRHTDGEQLVAATVELGNDVLTRLVAARTAREPRLLSKMVVEPRWLLLWTQHIIHGGSPWPVSIDRAAMCNLLLQGIDDVDLSMLLIRAISSDFAVRVLEWPERGKLWSRLPQDFVEQVAIVALERLNSGTGFPYPEEPLASRIIAVARRSRPTPAGLKALLQWPDAISERDLLTWIAAMPLDHVGVELGKHGKEKGWRRVAEALYRGSTYDSAAFAGAWECRTLLSSWQQFVLSYRGNRSAGAGQDGIRAIEDRIVAIGASYADERLRDIWIRAGGDVSRLSLSVYPRDRWRDAARAASSGALRGGLLALALQLLDEFPSNDELRDICSILSNS